MNYGIEDKLIQSIIQIFYKHKEIEKVIIFVSRAKGTYRNGSDIDLAIIGDIDIQNLNLISIELDNLESPYTFDLCNYNKINNLELKEHIDRVGKEIYITKK
jgi:predicted nucleotidyltransferase